MKKLVETKWTFWLFGHFKMSFFEKRPPSLEKFFQDIYYKYSYNSFLGLSPISGLDDL